MPPRKTAVADDLLGGLADDTSVVDLLDSINESGATPWKPENAGEGVQGTVIALSEVSSEYTDEMIPVVDVKDAEGNEWSVRGYASVLRREIQQNRPAVGDLFAVKYFGTKENKAGQKFHHYRVAVRKDTAPAAVKNDDAPF